MSLKCFVQAGRYGFGSFGSENETSSQRQARTSHCFGSENETKKQRQARANARRSRRGRNSRSTDEVVYRVTRTNRGFHVHDSFGSVSDAARSMGLGVAQLSYVGRAIRRGTHYTHGFLWFYGQRGHREVTAQTVEDMADLLRRQPNNNNNSAEQ